MLLLSFIDLVQFVYLFEIGNKCFKLPDTIADESPNNAGIFFLLVYFNLLNQIVIESKYLINCVSIIE